MKKWLQLLSVFSVLALVGAGCLSSETDVEGDVGVNEEDGEEGEEVGDDAEDVEDADEDDDEEDEAEGEGRVSASLSEQNDSNESGTITLTEEDGKTKVVLTVSGQPSGVAQPAHIHAGTCASIGAVVYPLTLVVNGRSETLLSVPLDTVLSAATDLSVNVHMSELELGKYVACADIDS